LADEEVTRFYDDEAFIKVSKAREQIEAWACGYEASQSIRWGIARREDDVIVGTCGYYGFHGWHRRGSLGFELARSHWRQGIMTEALDAIIGFGFREIRLNRIKRWLCQGMRDQRGY
jgi:ribosomal-protein-alanine N-acetyltransferase